MDRAGAYYCRKHKCDSQNSTILAVKWCLMVPNAAKASVAPSWRGGRMFRTPYNGRMRYALSPGRRYTGRYSSRREQQSVSAPGYFRRRRSLLVPRVATAQGGAACFWVVPLANTCYIRRRLQHLCAKEGTVASVNQIRRCRYCRSGDHGLSSVHPFHFSAVGNVVAETAT